MTTYQQITKLRKQIDELKIQEAKLEYKICQENQSGVLEYFLKNAAEHFSASELDYLKQHITFGPFSTMLTYDHHEHIYHVNCIYFEWDNMLVFYAHSSDENLSFRSLKDMSGLYWHGKIPDWVFAAKYNKLTPVAKKMCELTHEYLEEYFHSQFYLVKTGKLLT